MKKTWGPPRYIISTQPLQYIVQDINLMAERVWGRHTLGVMLAYRFTGWGINLFPDDQSASFLTDDYSALAVGINSKIFFKKTRSWYFDPQFYYRRWTEKTEIINDTLTDIYTKRVHYIGTKLLFGARVPLSRKGTLRPVMNFYAGIGGRMITKVNTQEYIRNGISDPSLRYKRKHYEPSIHLGFTLGAEWHKKTLVPID